ncbi:MAG: peptide-methionine (R)-S-oxide reductase MsrB [Bacteroidota bacterium]|jgi:methionine-R-sulfoxide reductase
MKNLKIKKTNKGNVRFLLLAGFISFVIATISCNNNVVNTQTKINIMNNEMNSDSTLVNKTDSEWNAQLTKDQYYVLRKKGTERPFTSKWENNYDGGIYSCVGCGNELFKSDSKFDAGCGWPSFFEALDSSKIKTEIDKTLGMQRVEIMCAKCGGHLGHVFDDGPKPTGLRYCVNGTALNFLKK